MATDRRLARDFWLHEFPRWEQASEEDVRTLEWTVRHLLQPTRRRWGKLVPTSWIRRFGDNVAHRHAGTVDFDVPGADLREVHGWMATYLAGQFGTLIFERDHLHVTQPGVQGRTGVVYTEPQEGVFELGFSVPELPHLIVLLAAATVGLAVIGKLLAESAPG